MFFFSFGFCRVVVFFCAIRSYLLLSTRRIERRYRYLAVQRGRNRAFTLLTQSYAARAGSLISRMALRTLRPNGHDTVRIRPTAKWLLLDLLLAGHGAARTSTGTRVALGLL